MKKTVLIIGLCINVNLYSQEVEDVPQHISQKDINMYEFGMQVTSCDCNFENLLFNWRYWVTNHEETKLLSYEYVEQLKSADRIAYYAKLMSSWESTMFGIGKSTATNSPSNLLRGSITVEITVVPSTYNEVLQGIPKEILADSAKMKLGIEEIKQQIEYNRLVLEDKMQEGDEIFLLKFEAKKKIYDYYVVCRPGENKILPYEQLSGIKLMWFELKAQ
ncbi:MAG: hypothetical protein LBC98_05485 [Prevotellaceae bacterium]|jgi:hypothetical protein|nr:hypothetical protein [Prevotellaceae bacterium]